MLSHFATNKKSLERVRAEYDSVVSSSEGTGSEDRRDPTLEECNELTYLGYVIQEALRVNPPAPLCTPYHFKQDTTIGKLKVKAYDPITISIQPMHQSSKLWKEPWRFNPDRFDLSHPDALTPEGKKRPLCSWLPFNGGKRVCFGKTFAEAVLRMLTTQMSQRFNFEFTGEAAGKFDENNLPPLILSQSHHPKLPVRVTLNKRK